MKNGLEWIPSALFDMAAVCEKNGCDKPRDILIEAALMLQIYEANQEANEVPVRSKASGISRFS